MNNQAFPRPDVLRRLENLAQPHVESFDYFLGDGMEKVLECLEGVEVEHASTKSIVRFWIENIHFGRPVRDDAGISAIDKRLFPWECREAGTTYKANCQVDLVWAIEGFDYQQRITKRLGQIPLMVKSNLCYLKHLQPVELVKHKEESTEFGGYFICNGIERIIRMLIVTRRHYIMALRRNAYHKRGPSFTDLATSIRCVRPDESSSTTRCHYLNDGSAVFAVTIRRAEYFIPAGILLKCFLEISDKEIYNKLVSSAGRSSEHIGFVAERAELLLRQSARYGLNTRNQCVEYLGSLFRVALDLPERNTDLSVGEFLLRNHFFVHLESGVDKLNMAYQMLLKLYALANNQCCEDNPDALTHHEVLLPGHLLLKFMREQLEVCLDSLRQQILRDLENSPEIVSFNDEAYIKKILDKWPDVGQKFEYLLNTGNLVSRSGLDLTQATGFTVVAEKLNFYRYISHFRSIHRGAYFAELRTTNVRKLLPESWGFLCPVHTPDGSPCGLLNHLTTLCRVVTEGPEYSEDLKTSLTLLLTKLGMVPCTAASSVPAEHLCVMLDGNVLGSVHISLASSMVAHLRGIKAAKLALEENLTPGAITMELEKDQEAVPSHLEIAHIPFEQGGTYPGVFLFSHAARFMRPVRQIHSGAAELLGTLEQHNMTIRCPDGGPGGSRGLNFSHEEFSPQSMLSLVASLTPYSDFNQSPRNMYQCQMAKQTMGTPTQVLEHRTDNKLYRLQTPQTPITRTDRYSEYGMDEFPNGTNAIVAVLAYTGYDMEDAMILNKSSVERGFAHASLYKTETVNFRQDRGSDLRFGTERAKQDPRNAVKVVGAFGNKFPQMVPSSNASHGVRSKGIHPTEHHTESQTIDSEGLPHVGAAIWPGQSYYSAVDNLTGRSKLGKLKGEETAVVDQVSIIGHPKDKNIRQANIKLRFNRNPVIGDKFSSRHGQKGVLSRLYDDIDMPFCESTGMRPDLIINPHAFPSRMTIGMLIESLTGKAGALNGQFVDATPFQNSDSDTQVHPCEDFAKALEEAGFARNGGETLISGVTGEPFPVDIYVGVVYYQRLRHMVSDKFQVRSTGAINPLTRQPIKGRKFGGGIRFGEMERDSLLAHGAAYLLHDRLHSCSDYHVMDVCASCGLLVSTLVVPYPATATNVPGMRPNEGLMKGNVVCTLCGTGSHVERVAVPFVFKYLVSELAAMNIRCSLDVK